MTYFLFTSVILLLTELIQIFHILTILNTNVPLMFHAKIQLIKPCGSGEEVNLVIFAVFSNRGHFRYWT